MHRISQWWIRQLIILTVNVKLWLEAIIEACVICCITRLIFSYNGTSSSSLRQPHNHDINDIFPNVMLKSNRESCPLTSNNIINHACMAKEMYHRAIKFPYYGKSSSKLQNYTRILYRTYTTTKIFVMNEMSSLRQSYKDCRSKCSKNMKSFILANGYCKRFVKKKTTQNLDVECLPTWIFE